MAAGWKDAIADPAVAIESLMKRNPAADPALEQRRLQLAIDANVVTEYTLENGMGGISADRMARALQQMSTTYEFSSPPVPSLYFDSAFLPADGFSLK